MLTHLSIRDIVLIERLDLHMAAGLGVLTGETGAGKSILLDALGLALGRRADAGLVRSGAAQGVVTAAFDVAPKHPAFALLAEQGLEAAEEGIVLRRVVSGDGKSRAFVNDQAVSIGLLRRLGDTLVEIHGQNDEQGLTDSAVHRALLDDYAGLNRDAAALKGLYRNFRDAETALAEAEAAAEQAQRDEEYLRHVVAELETLKPLPGEEDELAAQRSQLQAGEKLATAMQEAEAALLGGDKGNGVESRLRASLRALERVADRAGGQLDEAMQAAEAALDQAARYAQALDEATRRLDLDPQRLERVEERLFALRGAARKHSVAVAALPQLAEDFAAKLALIDDQAASLGKLRQAADTARAAFAKQAEALSAARRKAAAKLDKAVAAELAPLKLGTAKFQTSVETLPPEQWASDGADRVIFLAATNPGSAPGSLAKIASGGELSRFMLALRVVLAGRGDAGTLIFDEVDRGVGGATAAAVGERLARLSEKVQVLVVTHSPQVAAKGERHWRIAKRESGPAKARVTLTEVMPLQQDERREEIARMLAGATITDAARAAADELLLQQA
ncbi:DNA repair protein RecN [Ferrovibrio sp.]|uniref:DNA repair protein RecN n=1 Tax=Ferrovibrio sp. TaxID=1917215 RepID=UPI001B438D81|nr:DNA repair protein RecN [Ferrovibrio sp.]MBP7065394.1 DNA repair protein RecN [Ferrovibrio sp.]